MNIYFELALQEGILEAEANRLCNATFKDGDAYTLWSIYFAASRELKESADRAWRIFSDNYRA